MKSHVNRDDVLGVLARRMQEVDGASMRWSFQSWRGVVPELQTAIGDLVHELYYCKKMPSAIPFTTVINKDRYDDVPLNVKAVLLQEMKNNTKFEEYVVYRLYSQKAKRHYTGITKANEVDRRLKQHRGLKKGGAKATAGCDDWEVVWVIRHTKMNKIIALCVENFVKKHRIKSASRLFAAVQKEGVPPVWQKELAGGWMMDYPNGGTDSEVDDVELPMAEGMEM